MKGTNVLVCFFLFFVLAYATKYDPTWKSLDKRPLPEWYDDAKFGIFLHWGVFSVPSYVSAWFWNYWKTGNKDVSEYMKNNYSPTFTYADFASQFKAEFYDPDKWADLFEAAGARYLVFVAKHHEGFTNWPSSVSWNWNSMDVGPRRDLLGDLAKSVRSRTSIKFGVYHSLYEWYNPLYEKDKNASYHTQTFIERKTMPELYDLVNTYKPEVIWSDGDWEASPEYWNTTNFLAWLYSESPVKDTVVVNDRWGVGTNCKHGDFYNCEDRYHPKVLQDHKWENAMTVDRLAWEHRRDLSINDILSIEELLDTIITTVSCGGNVLLNVGPTKDGVIIPIFAERLLQIGTWLGVNGEGIYGTRPWKVQNDTNEGNVWYTRSNVPVFGQSVYAMFTTWPNSSMLYLESVISFPESQFTLLCNNKILSYVDIGKSGTAIILPQLGPSDHACKFAWTIKMTGVLANL